MQTVIQFAQDGSGHCLHTEAIDLAQLGKLTVQRASTVEFNEDSQLWEVLINGQLMHTECSRVGCLQWERGHFQKIIMGD